MNWFIDFSKPWQQLVDGSLFLPASKKTEEIPEPVVYFNLREANEARQEEWDTNGSITIAYRGNELAGEVGEACNIIKKLERERMGIRGSRSTKEALAEELADVIICADLIAMHEGIDLKKAVAVKFNKTSEANGLIARLNENF